MKRRPKLTDFQQWFLRELKDAKTLSVYGQDVHEYIAEEVVFDLEHSIMDDLVERGLIEEVPELSDECAYRLTKAGTRISDGINERWEAAQAAYSASQRGTG